MPYELPADLKKVFMRICNEGLHHSEETTIAQTAFDPWGETVVRKVPAESLSRHASWDSAFRIIPHFECTEFIQPKPELSDVRDLLPADEIGDLMIQVNCTSAWDDVQHMKCSDPVLEEALRKDECGDVNATYLSQFLEILCDASAEFKEDLLREFDESDVWRQTLDEEISEARANRYIYPVENIPEDAGVQRDIATLLRKYSNTKIRLLHFCGSPPVGWHSPLYYRPFDYAFVCPGIEERSTSTLCLAYLIAGSVPPRRHLLRFLNSDNFPTALVGIPNPSSEYLRGMAGLSDCRFKGLFQSASLGNSLYFGLCPANAFFSWAALLALRYIYARNYTTTLQLSEHTYGGEVLLPKYYQENTRADIIKKCHSVGFINQDDRYRVEPNVDKACSTMEAVENLNELYEIFESHHEEGYEPLTRGEAMELSRMLLSSEEITSDGQGPSGPFDPDPDMK